MKQERIQKKRPGGGSDEEEDTPQDLQAAIKAAKEAKDKGGGK